MIYTIADYEPEATIEVAKLMAVAARTAPKARGIDLIETIILDKEDKRALAQTMRELGIAEGKSFFIRDANCVDECHYVVIIGTSVKPRGLNCGFCGAQNCSLAENDGFSCAMSVNDLGIALGSAASIAMDNRVDNRILFSAGMASLQMKLLSNKVKLSFGIGLATTGKNIFFDRKPL